MKKSILELKSALRMEVRTQWKRVSRAERAAASRQASDLLRIQPLWKEARSVLFYAPLPDELDLSSLWETALNEGKILVLPRFVPDRDCYAAACLESAAGGLAMGEFGIREPAPECPIFPLNQLDLALVPGVAFDLGGRRVGRGRGYYDRLLTEVRGIKCGVAFDWQIREAIPAESHDVVLNCILTPTRWLGVGQRGL